MILTPSSNNWKNNNRWFFFSNTIKQTRINLLNANIDFIIVMCEKQTKISSASFALLTPSFWYIGSSFTSSDRLHFWIIKMTIVNENFFNGILLWFESSSFFFARLLPDYTKLQYNWCHWWNRTGLPFWSTWYHS